MKANRCKLCGEEHWSNEPHKWKDSPVSTLAVDSHKEVARKENPDEGGADNPKKRSTEKFDRTAYQREYMRKRRAK